MHGITRKDGAHGPGIAADIPRRPVSNLAARGLLPVEMSPPDRAEEFVFLLARHERLLGAYAMTMVPHPQDADDILQEAKVIMWRHFGKFELGTNFGAWARKIVFHQVLAYRKRKHRDRLDFSEEFLRTVADEAEQSAEHLERREKMLFACVEKLPREHREVLQLRYQEGLSLEDMASRLNRTVGALYRQLSRVRQSLHECVEKNLNQIENEPA